MAAASSPPSLEVVIRVWNLRHLPLALTSKGPFRIQASLGVSGSKAQGDERRETAGSIWGKGIKNRVCDLHDLSHPPFVKLGVCHNVSRCH